MATRKRTPPPNLEQQIVDAVLKSSGIAKTDDYAIEPGVRAAATPWEPNGTYDTCDVWQWLPNPLIDRWARDENDLIEPIDLNTALRRSENRITGDLGSFIFDAYVYFEGTLSCNVGIYVKNGKLHGISDRDFDSLNDEVTRTWIEPQWLTCIDFLDELSFGEHNTWEHHFWARELNFAPGRGPYPEERDRNNESLQPFYVAGWDLHSRSWECVEADATFSPRRDAFCHQLSPLRFLANWLWRKTDPIDIDESLEVVSRYQADPIECLHRLGILTLSARENPARRAPRAAPVENPRLKAHKERYDISTGRPPLGLYGGSFGHIADEAREADLPRAVRDWTDFLWDTLVFQTTERRITNPFKKKEVEHFVAVGFHAYLRASSPDMKQRTGTSYGSDLQARWYRESSSGKEVALIQKGGHFSASFRPLMGPAEVKRPPWFEEFEIDAGPWFDRSAEATNDGTFLYTFNPDPRAREPDVDVHEGITPEDLIMNPAPSDRATLIETWQLTRPDVPWSLSAVPVGTWRMDPDTGGVEQLREIPLSEIGFMEDTRDPAIRRYVEEYTRRWRAGERPQPPTLIWNAKQGWITLNRRRVLAAKAAAETKILAWCSDTKDGRGVTFDDVFGEDLIMNPGDGLYVDARGGRWADPDHTVPYSPQTHGGRVWFVPAHEEEQKIAAAMGFTTRAKVTGFPSLDRSKGKTPRYLLKVLVPPEREEQVHAVQLRTDDGSRFAIVHRGSKANTIGRWQVSYFDDDGAVGDTVRDTLEEAIEDARLSGYRLQSIR